MKVQATASFLSGVGLKVLLFQKSLMANCLSHAFRNSSVIWTAVDPDQKIVGKSHNADLKCNGTARNTVRIRRPSCFSHTVINEVHVDGARQRVQLVGHGRKYHGRVRIGKSEKKANYEDDSDYVICTFHAILTALFNDYPKRTYNAFFL